MYPLWWCPKITWKNAPPTYRIRFFRPYLTPEARRPILRGYSPFKGAAMFIQTEQTPNPATLKFLPGQVVLEKGTADFPSADQAGKSPLAKGLFAIDGVR